MPVLEIRLLGGFAVSHNGSPILAIRSARQQSLIAWLLLHSGQAQLRSRVAATLWPETGDAQARNNLRKLLHDLREAWPDVDEWVVSDRDTVSWAPSDYNLDVAQFTALLEEPADSHLIRQAVSVYAGDLLPDCYDEWIMPHRDRLRQSYMSLLERGTSLAEAERDYKTAIVYAQRLVQEEPLGEDFHLSLMRLHVKSGSRTAALRQYHSCASILREELSVNPGSDVQQMYRSLLDAPAPMEQPCPRPSGLVGRDAAWARLQAIWASTVGDNGRSSVAVITGDPGIGKTRLAEEMNSWADRQGLAVARAVCYRGEENLPFTAVSRLLRNPAVMTRLPALQPVWLREIGRLVPEVHQNGISDPTAVDRPIDEHSREVWQHRLLLDAIANALLLLQPAILFVDDLQWADPDSLFAFEHLLTLDNRARLLILATSRAGGQLQESPIFRDSRLQALIVEIELDALTSEETAQLALDLTPSMPTNDVSIQAIFDDTEGNPLFVVELARGGWPKVGSGETDCALPPTLQSAIRGRFADLPVGAIELVRVAATIGGQFTAPLLARASSQDESELVRNLDLLWRRRIFREQGNGYDFSHGRLRDVAYRDLNTARRALLHGHVGTALESLRGSSSHAGWAEIAQHFELAGDYSKAGRLYLQAAQDARNLYAYEASVSNYRRAVDLLPPAERPPVMAQLARTLQLSGEPAEADHVYRAALAQATQSRDYKTTSECQAGIGDLLRLRGRPQESLEWLQSACREIEHSERQIGLLRILGLLAEVSIWLSHSDAAKDYASRQLSLAEASGDVPETSAALANLGTVCARQAQYEQALKYYLRHLSLEERLNDRVRIQRSLGLIGNVYRLMGDLQRAQEYFENQLRIAREIGNASGEGLAAFSLGLVYEERGNFETAVTWVEKALSSACALGERQREGAALCNLGVLYHDLGRLSLGWKTLVEGMKILGEVGDTRNVAVALGNLGMIYGDCGADEACLNCLIASLLISLDIDNPQNVAITCGALGECCLQQGREGEAEQFLVRSACLTRRLQMNYWLSRDLNQLGRIRADEASYTEAIELNTEAIALAKESHNRSVWFKAELFGIRLLREQRQCDEAAAISLVHGLRRKLDAGDLHGLAPPTPEELATLHDEVWKLGGCRDDERDEVVDLYRALYRDSPTIRSARRLEELTGEAPAGPDPLPDPPPLVGAWNAELPDVFDRLDEWMRSSSPPS